MPYWKPRRLHDEFTCQAGPVLVSVYRLPGQVSYRLETTPPVVERRNLDESLVKSQALALELVRQFGQAVVAGTEE